MTSKNRIYNLPTQKIKNFLYTAATVTAFLLFALFLAGCTRNESPISKTGFYFDTVIQITLYDHTDSAYLDGCFALAKTYENRFSATKENSDIWNINHACGSPVTVSGETIDLLQTALDYARLTDGKIDPSILSLSALWDFHDEKTSQVPSDKEIQEALSHIDYRKIAINKNTVTLSDSQAALDLGFIAKGYIADRMKEYLLEHNVQSACINLGGNVLTIGNKPDAAPFRIGIQKPFAAEGTIVMAVPVSDMSLVSSGIYERYFYENDVLYHHILDTRTGYPVDNTLTSVTILSPSSVEGDALSTVCYVLGLDEGIALVESLDNVEALFITKDGILHTTSGFPVS